MMMLECEAFDTFATAGGTDADCTIMYHHTALPCTVVHALVATGVPVTSNSDITEVV